jgi:cytochrome c peroxidase
VLRPFVNDREFGLRSYEQLSTAIHNDPHYSNEFQQAFGVSPDDIGLAQIASALASYIRSLGGRLSRFDCFNSGSAPNTLSVVERDGFEVFRQDAHCASCHLIDGRRSSFTDNRFHVSGVGAGLFSGRLSELSRKVASLDQKEREDLLFTDPAVAAAGRYIVSLDPKDIGAFRTPSLRNVAQTAPYMHDGSIGTLEEAVDYELYYTGSQSGNPIIITPKQRQALLAFLRTLNDTVDSTEECSAFQKSS